MADWITCRTCRSHTLPGTSYARDWAEHGGTCDACRDPAMRAEERRMLHAPQPLDQAEEAAAGVLAALLPLCARAEVAGSIRRRSELVKDVEIVAVPRDRAALHSWALRSAPVRWIKPGTSEIVTWEPKADGRYWRGLLPGGLKLDLFLAAPDNHGLILAIRTGAAEFSKALVTHAGSVGRPSRDGYLWDGERRIATPDEDDVFGALGLRWVPPDARTGAGALRRAA